jgi:hypothetical protein
MSLPQRNRVHSPAALSIVLFMAQLSGAMLLHSLSSSFLGSKLEWRSDR